MQTSKRTISCLLIFAMLLFSLGASAQSLTGGAPEMRYHSQEGESYLITAGDEVGEGLLESLGLTKEEASRQMTAGNIALWIALAGGQQARVIVLDAPDGYTEMDAWQKSDNLIKALAAQFAAASYAWLDDGSGYACLQTPVTALGFGDAPGMALTEVRLATIYQEKLVVIETDVIGREVTQDDIALLGGVTGRLIRLKGMTAASSDTDAQKTLPAPSAQLSERQAEFTVISDQLPLSIDPILADYPSTTLILTGTTKKATAMRYSVNGKNSSRFYSNDDGTFRVTVPSLENGKDNEIHLFVMEDKQTGEVSFTLKVDRQPAPVSLSMQFGSVAGDSVTINGLALAGSKVAFAKRTAKSKLDVNKDGSFTLTAMLPDVGENKLSLTIEAKGYADNTVELSYLRLPENDAQLEQLVSDLPQLDYAMLLGTPETNKGDMGYLEGEVTGLSYFEGMPYYCVKDAQGQSYAVCSQDITGIDTGDSVRVLMRVAGENSNLFTDAMPMMNEISILSDK